jgi:tRNA (pseudouridine54-N1)-methyltransferase
LDWAARNFILRARNGPTAPRFSLDNLPSANHLEVVAQSIANALFYANQHRFDTSIWVVLEGPPCPPRVLAYRGDSIGSLGGFDERSIAASMRTALAQGTRLGRDETVICESGIEVTHRSFESMIKAAAIPGFYYLDKKGSDIREASFASPAIFVLSDHKSMPRKSMHYLARLGGRPIALGPKTIFASQCVVLVHNDLDRQAIQ